MAADNKRKHEDKETAEPQPAHGDHTAGAVDGIGGTGGASGTGSVRAKANSVGDISGIDAIDDADVPAPGSVGKGKAGSRSQQMSDGGLSGKTRGEDSETVPNQTNPAE